MASNTNEFIILIPTRIFGFSPLRQTCSRKSCGLPLKGVDNHSNSAWSINTDDSLLMFRSRNCADDVSRGTKHSCNLDQNSVQDLNISCSSAHRNQSKASPSNYRNSVSLLSFSSIFLRQRYFSALRRQDSSFFLEKIHLSCLY